LGSDVVRARALALGAVLVAVGRMRTRLLVVALGIALAAVYVPMALFRLVDADEGIYLASQPTFSRASREHGEVTHRGRAKTSQGATTTYHVHRYRHTRCGAGILLICPRR